MRFDAAVGTVSQLMIFTEPASAVSQPRPTPASQDNTANTATNITADAAVAAANAVHAASIRACRAGDASRPTP